MPEIIAEIGKNFVDTQEEQPIPVLLEKAKKLIFAAKESRADTAKFQAHYFPDEINPNLNTTSPHFDVDRHSWVTRNTYSPEFWGAIKDYCHEVDINFLVTPMSRGAAMLLDEVGVDRWKIGSGDILDFVMLDYIRQSGKPIILSSGMSLLEELREAYNYLREKTEDVSILHCVSEYPCPLENLNLKTITLLKKEFPNTKIGFSDHSIFKSTGRMAVQLGAEIIEKHFTLDKNAWGPDHKASLEPREFKEMIQEINDFLNKRKDVDYFVPDEPLGIETKFINEEELKFRPVFRKGLFASSDIPKDKLLEPDDFYALRPKGDAMASQNYPLLIGTLATRDYKRYEAIK